MHGLKGFFMDSLYLTKLKMGNFQNFTIIKLRYQLVMSRWCSQKPRLNKYHQKPTVSCPHTLYHTTQVSFLTLFLSDVDRIFLAPNSISKLAQALFY